MTLIRIAKQPTKVSISSKPQKVQVEIPEGAVVKKSGDYEVIDTTYVGIKRIINKTGGYLVTLDYGRVMKTNTKTGLKELKQDKTVKVVKTLTEAKKLRAEAELIRKKRKKYGPEVSLEGHKTARITIQHAIEMYKKEGDYIDLREGYQKHLNNYINHVLDYFNDFEPSKITVIDVENFYRYQLEHGNRDKNKKKKQPGISINTLTKYKTVMIKIWDYMVMSKKFNVSENIIKNTKIPKVTITIDGLEKKVSKITHVGKSLSIEELNITLNDLAQNEFDRSLLMLVALSSIGGLRRGEIASLELGKYYHNELMEISDEIYDYSKYDKEYYEENNNLFMISVSVERVGNQERKKLPKWDRIRVVGKPRVLEEIIEYCMEQRKEVNTIIGDDFESTDQLYYPLVNIIRREKVHAEKISRKWELYQVRRNKRLEAKGEKPIQILTLHELRHSHSNLLKYEIPEWQISLNMGHKLKGNTTSEVYWNDRRPNRDNIIRFFDSNIKIDWDKVLRRKINMEDSQVRIMKNGQLIIGEHVKTRLRELKGRAVLTEEELAELMALENEEFIGLKDKTELRFNTAREERDSIDD